MCRYLVALVILNIAATCWAEKESYPIQLHRAWKVGDIYDTHAILEQTEIATITLADLPPQVKTREIKANLQAQVKILEVSEHGKATSLELTVKKFTDETGKNLIDTDKVIAVKRDAEQSSFTSKTGEDVSEEAKSFLKRLYPPERGGTGDDAIFGDKMPRKVGESWPIDLEAGAKSFSQGGLTVDPKEMTGTTTLKAIEEVNGEKALRIVGTIEMTNLKPPAPAGVTVESCSMKAQYSGLYPLNVSQPQAENEVTSDMTILMTGNGVKIEAKAQLRQKKTTTPVK